MTAKADKADPKRLSEWAPFAWLEKLKEWQRDNSSTDKLEWDARRGRFVHTHKEQPTVWVEAGVYASQKEFALAQGIIGPRDV